jgi:hypothetical protein
VLWLAVAAVLVVVGAVVLAGASPLEAGRALLSGSLGSASAVSGTLKEFTPLWGLCLA